MFANPYGTKNHYKAEAMNSYKQDVSCWYAAFTNKDPTLLDGILSERWVDIPPAPDQPPGPEGLNQLLVQLTTTFPDLKCTIEEVLQDGNKVSFVQRSQARKTECSWVPSLTARQWQSKPWISM